MAEFDRFALNYDDALNAGLSTTGETKEFFARGRIQCLSRRLRELGIRAGSVMDFGCGTGSTTSLLRELLGADRVFGVDVSEGLLDVARRQHPAPGVTFITPKAWPSRVEVDLVYCNGVFHHIEPSQRPEYVRFVCSALRRGGIFALWENNPWNPGTRLVMSRIPFDRDAKLMSAWQAQRLLRREGLDPLGVEYAFVFPHFLEALRPLERYLSGWPLGGQYQVLAKRP
jgi:SAM-dependent methyltransferase